MMPCDRRWRIRASGSHQATIVRNAQGVDRRKQAGLWFKDRRGPPELFAVEVEMKMKILIAYDGTERADAAIDDLLRAGLPGRAEALVVVTDVWLTSYSSEFSRAVARRRILSSESSSFAPALREVEEGRALSREALRRLRALFPAWDVRAEVAGGMGSAASALLRRASTWGADLLVVGSGCGTVQDQNFGDPTRQVAAEAPCSVRFARTRAGESGSAVRLLVGVEGSPAANSAFRAVAAREWPAGSECIVIANAPQDHRAAETLRASGLKITTLVTEGELCRTLVEEAARRGADCIFVGTHGREEDAKQTGSRSLITSLVAGSNCTVEVARSSLVVSAGAFVPIARASVQATVGASQ
jgi:nucleotide-binding universal stress UspA family protein